MEKRFRNVISLISRTSLCLALVAAALTVHAQSASAEADGGQKRLKRARALVAAHKLEAAASELNAIRNTTTDDSVRDVARIMLMSIFLEEGDYMRAQSLLEETYVATQRDRTENSTRTYYALAGQVVGGAREHLSRYRSFGINISDKELPAEATSDLDHMRMLLERVAAQARELCSTDGKSFDALGLLEEAASIRGTLARNSKERLQWQRELADVRQKLSNSEIRIASLGSIPAGAIPTANVATAPAIISTAANPNHSVNAQEANKNTATAAQNQPAPSAAQANSTGEGQNLSAPADGKPLDIGSLIDKATQRVNPAYPQIAKQAHVTGVVTIYLEVDENGSVSTIHRVNGPQLLRQAATDAARRWKFRPTVISGQPVRVQGYINFNFTL